MHTPLVTGLGLLLSSHFALATGIESRQIQTLKYCAADGVCYSEFIAPTSNISYRIAIPDTPTASFDVLLQISAPSTVGWAGLAWGGVMAKNPLTVAWPNGDSVVVSSRWATGHTLPGAYSGATYTVLSSSKDAATWKIDLLCTGCSSWEGASLNPNGANTFAWAMSTRPPTNPASNTSGFPAHTAKSKFDHDLSVAKLPAAKFSALVQSLMAPTTPASSTSSILITSTQPTATSQQGPGSSSASANTLQSSSTLVASSPSGTASVITGVTTLPKPTHSLPSLSINSTAVVVSTGVTILPSPTAKPTTPATTASLTLSSAITTTTQTFDFDPPIPKTSFTISRIPDSPWTQTTPIIKSSPVISVSTIARSSSVRPSPVQPSPVRPTPPRGRPPPGRGPPWRHHPP